MSYLSQGGPEVGGPPIKIGTGPGIVGASTLVGDVVYNHRDEEVGDLREIILDLRSGRIAYAILSLSGLQAMGEKLLPVPWGALSFDEERTRLVLPQEKESLRNAPGFHKNRWPNMSDPSWKRELEAYYGIAADDSPAASDYCR